MSNNTSSIFIDSHRFMNDFDDKSWPQATEYGTNGARPWGMRPDIDKSAKWIWTSENKGKKGSIYCRWSSEEGPEPGKTIV